MTSAKNTGVSDPVEWAKRTARRLRVAHGSFSDQSFEQKRGYLEDELESCLNHVGAENGELREEMLAALGDLFPVYGDVLEAGDSEEALSNQEGSSGEEDPVEVVVEGWRRMSSEERARAWDHLGFKAPEATSEVKTATLGPVEGISLPSTDDGRADLKRTIDKMREVLGLEDGVELHYTRIFKILGMLVDHFDGLHDFLWKFWDRMEPREMRGQVESDFAKTFRKAVSGYLTGDDEIDSSRLAEEIARTKLLAIASCSAILRGGEEFGRQHSEIFSPESIESTVLIEDSGGDARRVKDLEKKAWLKYRQLAKNLTAEGVDDELKLLIGQLIGLWVKRKLR